MATFREAYHKKSDALSKNKLTLTPRNIRNEIFKFYMEHLHPIKPPPSFRHTLMWALQTGGYCLNWQFDFNTQMNWSAVEANWQLAVNPRAAENYAVVEAAAFRSEKPCQRPGEWADDEYVGVAFSSVCTMALDLREDERNADMESNMANEQAHHRARESNGESTDLNGLAIELADLVDARGDDDDDDDLNLPEYAEAEAQRQEENGRTMSEDDDDGTDDEESDAARRAGYAAGRSKFVLDEAEE